jgi:hypothetical protein
MVVVMGVCVTACIYAHLYFVVPPVNRSYVRIAIQHHASLLQTFELLSVLLHSSRGTSFWHALHYQVTHTDSLCCARLPSQLACAGGHSVSCSAHGYARSISCSSTKTQTDIAVEDACCQRLASTTRATDVTVTSQRQ